MIFLNVHDNMQQAPTKQFARARVVFPVRDTDYEGKFTTQRNMNLQCQEHDVKFVEDVERHIVDLAVQNSKAWFGKAKMSREVVADRLESIIKVNKSGEYPPTVRFKVLADPQKPDKNTVVREIIDTDKTNNCAEFQMADANALTRDSETVVKGTWTSIWFAGGRFGIKLVAKDLILWPKKKPADEENPFEGYNLSKKRKHAEGFDDDHSEFDLPLVIKRHSTAYVCATEGCAGCATCTTKKQKKDDGTSHAVVAQ